MTTFEKIKTLADIKGYSIARLERESGIANGVIKEWHEHGSYSYALYKVAKTLGVKMDDLMPDELKNAEA